MMTSPRSFAVVVVSLLVLCVMAPYCAGQAPAAITNPGAFRLENVGIAADLSAGPKADSADSNDGLGSAAIVRTPSAPKKEQPSVEWKPLAYDSLRFIVLMNAFRIATEPGTRAGLHNPLFSGYINAIQNLHGWDDGDPFYVNYIGHPMQGAVSSFIWSNRDAAFNREHIGWNSGYAKAKLRSGAFAYALSLMFEIGPVSEASIGQIQRYKPATGVVDHVITPSVGLMWSAGEDAVDDSLVRYIEEHSDNVTAKTLARSVLNPARSFANLMAWKYPWYRTNRPGASAENSFGYFAPAPKDPVVAPKGVPPFQFNLHFETRRYFGKNASDPCLGGGAELGFRLSDSWQIVGEVTGCKQTGMQPNFSGDSLTYAAGPQWTSRVSERWVTHTRLLLGGNKVAQEQVFPQLRQELLQQYGTEEVFPPLADKYIHDYDNNAFAVVTGAGFDYKLNRALSFHSALDYSHTWNREINGVNYRDSLRFSSGIVLSMGVW